MFNKKESRNMETKIENVLPFAKRKKLLGMIRKAKYCFAWVLIYREDGEYIQVTKGSLKNIIENASGDTLNLMLNETFTLREDGDLYVN